MQCRFRISPCCQVRKTTTITLEKNTFFGRNSECELGIRVLASPSLFWRFYMRGTVKINANQNKQLQVAKDFDCLISVFVVVKG